MAVDKSVAERYLSSFMRPLTAMLLVLLGPTWAPQWGLTVLTPTTTRFPVHTMIAYGVFMFVVSCWVLLHRRIARKLEVCPFSKTQAAISVPLVVARHFTALACAPDNDLVWLLLMFKLCTVVVTPVVASAAAPPHPSAHHAVVVALAAVAASLAAAAAGTSKIVSFPVLACLCDLLWRAWWRWASTDRRKPTDGCSHEPRTARYNVWRALERQHRSALAYPTLVTSSPEYTAWVSLVLEGLIVLPVGCSVLLFQHWSSRWEAESTMDFLDEAVSEAWLIPSIAAVYLLTPLASVLGARTLSPTGACLGDVATTLIGVLVAQALGYGRLRMGTLIALLAGCWLQVASVLWGAAELRWQEQSAIVLDGNFRANVGHTVGRWRNACFQPPDSNIFRALDEESTYGVEEAPAHEDFLATPAKPKERLLLEEDLKLSSLLQRVDAKDMLGGEAILPQQSLVRQPSIPQLSLRKPSLTETSLLQLPDGCSGVKQDPSDSGSSGSLSDDSEGEGYRRST